MNAFLKERGLRTFGNKVLHLLEFFYATGLDSLRVMKDKAWVTSKDHFIFNVVHSALWIRYLKLEMGCIVTTCAYLCRFLDLCTINLGRNYQHLARSKSERRPYLFSLIIVDLWVLCRVADSLENGCFTRVGSADDENPEPSKFLSKIFDRHSENYTKSW